MFGLAFQPLYLHVNHNQERSILVLRFVLLHSTPYPFGGWKVWAGHIENWGNMYFCGIRCPCWRFQAQCSLWCDGSGSMCSWLYPPKQTRPPYDLKGMLSWISLIFSSVCFWYSWDTWRVFVLYGRPELLSLAFEPFTWTICDEFCHPMRARLHLANL